MKTKLIAVLASSIMLTSAVSAQNSTSLKTQGEGFAFSLNVPAGWVNDPKATEGQHLKGLMLPADQRWETASSRIYTSVSDLDRKKGETIIDVIEYDTHVYKTVANCVVTELDPIALSQGQSARVLKIEGAGDGYEAIAYIGENRAVPFVVLSSTSLEAFQKDFATFKQVVSTYTFADNTAVAHD